MMIDDSLLRHIAAPATDLALSFARRRELIAINKKGPGDFATEADRSVETAIRDALYRELGEVPIIGEEHGGSLDQSLSGWVIDPIDGTSNFLRGLPLWGISIGRLELGEPTHGIIVLPEFGIALTGIRGFGTRYNGKLISAPPQRSPVKTLAIGENEFEPGSVTDEFAEQQRQRGFDVVRYRCAVFSLASVALHRLDGYVENGCCLWDIAAGWIVCHEAGVAVKVATVGNNRYAVSARWG
jgi:myo-inositol-1(or 4)-monophosphatase